MQEKTIICVTPNAALDRTLVVPDFEVGRISRIPNAIAVPGGKGLNVLRAVKILGGRGLAMGLLGGHTGRMVAAMMAEEGNDAEWTSFNGESRTCTIIARRDGQSTVINESGSIKPEDWMRLSADICRIAERDDVGMICLCGSLPDGAPPDAPADLIEGINAMGKQIWVDSSKQSLANAIRACPHAVKVNREEMAAATGVSLRNEGDILRLARHLLAAGLRVVVVSLGADGALLCSESTAVKATPPAIQPVDPVASGDCLHAGILTALAGGAGLAEALRAGVAAGTVNALYAGGAQFSIHHYKEILAATRVEALTD